MKTGVSTSCLPTVPALQCTLALHMPGAMKWQMIWALMSEAKPRWRGIWKGLRDSYDYVMVADDDLIMDACTIDILFDVSEDGCSILASLHWLNCMHSSCIVQQLPRLGLWLSARVCRRVYARVSHACLACCAQGHARVVHACLACCAHALQTMRRYELLAAQPSNCRGDDSDNPYW